MIWISPKWVYCHLTYPEITDWPCWKRDLCTRSSGELSALNLPASEEDIFMTELPVLSRYQRVADVIFIWFSAENVREFLKKRHESNEKKKRKYLGIYNKIKIKQTRWSKEVFFALFQFLHFPGFDSSRL